MDRPAFKSFLFVFYALIPCFLCKECTNVPSELSSHTFRHNLLSSKNKQWQESVFSSYKHLVSSDDLARSGGPHPTPIWLLQREQAPLSAESQFNPFAIKNSAQANRRILNEISLHNVRLDADSIYGKAQQTNLEYLLMLDVDSLVWSFRKTAGLDTPGSPYGGWEGPTVELRGHFVGLYLTL